MSYTERIPQKIMSREDLLKKVHFWKMQNQKIVFTNGVFDLMHRGHVEYLMKAADLGNQLIVGLNSDASVKLLHKGSSRPLQDEKSRALILASLQFISAIVLFPEENPGDLIAAISPDILVKGGDYRIEDIAGSNHVMKSGGKVTTIPLVEGYSTSNIEKKIKES